MQFLVVVGGGGTASEAAAALAVRGRRGLGGGVRGSGSGGDALLGLLAFRP